MGILQYEHPAVDTIDISNPLLKAITKYKNHHNAKLIKNTFNLNTYSFHYVDESGIEKQIMNVTNSKTSEDSDIPVKITKDNLDIFKKNQEFILGIK